MTSSKITPALWFHTQDGTLASVIAYYAEIFGDAFVAGTPMPLGETPSGNAELCKVTLFGASYSFMSTAQEHHAFNDALSFVLSCRDQEEIDRYWNYFTKEGSEVMCGWCTDAHGLRWQIIPENLEALLRTPHGHEVMMRQKKIVIAEYEG